jgi:hypothetical protein
MGAMLVVVTTFATSITEIELEENLRRKDLTPGEVSKEMVRKAERVAPALSSAIDDKRPRGHKRTYAAPKVVGPGYRTINDFLREAVDFSPFNVQQTHPQLVQLIKELQPEASNRAIAEAIGVSEFTVRNDQKPTQPDTARNIVPEPTLDEPDEAVAARNIAPAIEDQPDEEDAEVCDEADAAEVIDGEDDVEEEIDLPTFLGGDDWTTPERALAYTRYLSLPPDLQPTVSALLEQPGICVPDILAMLAHINGTRSHPGRPRRLPEAGLGAGQDAGWAA